MALDNYYHNKIEAMKLEILKGQAVSDVSKPSETTTIRGCGYYEKSWVSCNSLDRMLVRW